MNNFSYKIKKDYKRQLLSDQPDDNMRYSNKSY